jgi:hypothetical protein
MIFFPQFNISKLGCILNTDKLLSAVLAGKYEWKIHFFKGLGEDWRIILKLISDKQSGGIVKAGCLNYDN